MENCKNCGILECQQTNEGWEVSDGEERSVTFLGGLDCKVRKSATAEIPFETADELKIYMLHLLQNIGMPDIARDLDNGTIFLSTPSEAVA
jgi:hypothetical protein